MGCGGEKGQAEKQTAAVTEITFKQCDLRDMDLFFDKAKEFLDSIPDITGPLGVEKEKFFDATGFYLVPGAGKIKI